MATVIVVPHAADDLDTLIRTHSLPADATARVRRTLRPLERFPLLGAPLEGRWHEFRFVLGPWRWMILVYAYDAEADLVWVVTIQDGRSSGAATAAR
ncbi:MAG: hypothetical protein ACXVZ4_10590 [Gaiellaceae bacterium]